MSKSFRYLLVLLLALPVVAEQQQPVSRKTAAQNSQQPTLTIDGVLAMVQAGLSDDVIIARLRKEDKPFDLGPDDMIRLKQAKVSDTVMKVMLDPTASSPTAPTGPLMTGPTTTGPTMASPPMPASARLPHAGPPPSFAAITRQTVTSPAATTTPSVTFDQSGMPNVTTRDAVTITFFEDHIRVGDFKGGNYIVRHEKATTGRFMRNALAPTHAGTGYAGEGEQYLAEGGATFFDSAQGVNASHVGYASDRVLLLPKQISQVIVDAVEQVHAEAGHELFKPKGYEAIKEVSKYRLNADGSQH